MFILLATLCSYGRANPRRSIQELGVTILDTGRPARGGITIYGTIRQYPSELANEHSSQTRLKQEGFDPRMAFRRRTHVWSYNCQMMNAWRLENWGRELDGCFVLVQGTQQTYDPSKGERGLQHRNTRYHDVYEARVRKKGKGCQPEGVSILGPKGSNKIVRKVFTPRDRELEGRALAVWYSRGLFDICMITLYCPLGDRNPENQRNCEKLWNWVGMVKSKIPQRTRIILGTDANGHVGSVRETTVELDPREQMEILTDAHYPHTYRTLWH